MSEIAVSNTFGLLLLDVGFLIVITLFVAYFFKKIGIPAVMGILIGGILIGFNESYRSFLFNTELESFRLLITELAIGYIAYDIGNEIDLRIWKDKTVRYLAIIISETTIPFLFVTLTFLLVFKFNLGISIIIGAIAMTSAPVLTSEILGDYHTNEELNQVVLFLLAFDSVLSILVINIGVTIVTVPALSVNLVESIIILLLQKLGISLALSCLGSLFILYMVNRKHLEERSLLEWILGVSLVILGITLTLNGSVILTMMFFGVILKTLENRYEILTEHILQIEILMVPVVLMFYIIMGLSIDVLYSLGAGLVFIVSYVVLRGIGKISGTLLPTRSSSLPGNIKNNLHYFLITQGGIAIALAGLAYNQLITLNLQEEATSIITIIGVGVIISELIGPLLLRFGIIKTQNGTLLSNHNQAEETNN